MKVKWYKIVVWILIGALVLFFLLAVWYKNMYSMEAVEPYAMYSQTFDKKLLIATQSSIFKDSLVRNVVRHYENDSVFIKIIDVSDLPEIDHSDFNAVWLLHTWEYGKPPEAVEAFVNANKNHLEKIIVLTTSGEGNNTIEGVDGLAGESIIKNIILYTDWTILKLDILLSHENSHAYLREF
ncbi:hypothetical protein Murru_0444 [Allomuricauda ruestringensis DSM 13258]|uniref:Flavodoxin-like domain-containing protein n=1 Tax=Allomuricauda ruestringensis (strain DSM 13258 / CIP 107369 / LMG 19739 / B1) TaxID=886377 RepID=G2PRP9_ALLRU|nr:hypothetical protein [Allomuricauda ruestringensis]AEM69498.1 hypothetical protein Murru_0444 [Allomuricauda ruestringensis DSM 13258]